ncbi:PilZ domain-containing protein [Rhodopirellula sallentina]|uniref:Type IV pilus assembly PilZ domain protein n=1 Tax=Rhodopirellula sallentina SM41 TaxID=1263870 RepID=M5U6W1_9BACT|nr:PilZ domain-containing protein [Rhodopirellula sallentina]EMI57019.1 Type IV pilus assembly PilZ domain protein [Rhodopirellula sallentina SM41]
MSASTPSPGPAQNRNGDRFHARNTANLTAELLVLHEDDVIRHPCQMADISVGGCAVRVSLDRPEEITVAVLRMQDTSGEVDIEVAGRLCWNQQTSVGSNTFGFQFRRLMDPNLIDHMVSAGLVTRRQETRIQLGTPIQVRRAHGKPVLSQATLEDFSTTGVRIHADKELDVAERLLLTTSSGASGSVSVKWIKPCGDQFECGCIFQNLNSARAINDALAS